MTNRKFQHGYTLVEIAIVLTAALMMSSWLAVNFFEWKENLDNQAATRDIEIIKESIIDYAADHSAGVSELVNLNANNVTANNVTVVHRLPSGRPYLPCPDTTGDGVENRTNTYVPGGIITLVGNATTPGGGFLDTRGSGCVANKGFVPWRTLGTSPSDPWGNRYTYRVDATFADEALGFDQETESSDRRRTNELYAANVSGSPGVLAVLFTIPFVTGHVVISLRINEDGDTIGAVNGPDFVGGSSAEQLEINRQFNRQLPPGTPTPALDPGFTEFVSTVTVGGDVSLRVSQNPVAANAAAADRPGIICSASPCSSAAAATLIVAGSVADADDTALMRGGYDLDVPIQVVYNDNNIISGLPVVVLSHGSNGYGAIPFDSNTPPTDDDCHAIPIRNLDEIQNALGVCQPVPLPATFLSGAAQSYGFVARPLVPHRTGPRNAAITQEFDDVVGWMSADEIIEALRRRGTLPVDLLPPVGLEDF